jgi:GNAT superfamily N-acetyltransferase
VTDGLDVELVDVGPGDRRLADELLPVLRELRTHLTAESFAEAYERGHPEGLRFLAAYVDGACVGVAGWRIVHNTSSGRKLYVDDLVTSSARRSAGVGRALLAELEARARAAGCSVLDLDSGTQRRDAHRFYHRESLTVRSFHFAKEL